MEWKGVLRFWDYRKDIVFLVKGKVIDIFYELFGYIVREVKV